MLKNVKNCTRAFGIHQTSTIKKGNNNKVTQQNIAKLGGGTLGLITLGIFGACYYCENNKDLKVCESIQELILGKKT